MGFYPYNPDLGQEIQTDLPGTQADRAFVAHVSWATPAAADADVVHAAVTLADGATTTVTIGITNPDVPRCLSITGNAATATGDVVITGTDIEGNALEETIVSTGAATVNGTKAFKTVTQIVFPARGAAADTISVGVSDKLGLPYKLAANTVLAAALNNVREATAPTVAVSSSDIESNTIDLNSVLDGTKVDAWLLV